MFAVLGASPAIISGMRVVNVSVSFPSLDGAAVQFPEMDSLLVTNP
jgi:hypothetical protein